MSLKLEFNSESPANNPDIKGHHGNEIEDPLQHVLDQAQKSLDSKDPSVFEQMETGEAKVALNKAWEDFKKTLVC